ncbi:MAG: hypothetical protein JNL61_02495 [Rhizobiaceae bacterium]|nr:hypothetical protein [Rhizobiaceae bacterium]
MPPQRILDFQTYSNPLFDRFVGTLEDRLRVLGREAGLSVSDFDELYARLVSWDKEKTRSIMTQTAFDVVGQPKMYDRLWDAVAAYCAFLSAHARRPTTRPLLNDVMFHVKTTAEILKPLRVFVTDKELAKIYVAGLIGRSYCVDTTAVLRSDAEIDRYDFPADCAVKPTHLSGSYQFAHSGIDKTAVKAWLRQNYYLMTREANYGHLDPKIIIEPFLGNYYEVKVYCLFGEPKLLNAVLGNTTRRRNDYFTVDWTRLDVQSPLPPFEGIIPKPRMIEEILEISRVLSSRFNLVRLDFYTNDDDIKVGEITNCDNSGTRVYKPQGAHELVSKVIFG